MNNTIGKIFGWLIAIGLIVFFTASALGFLGKGGKCGVDKFGEPICQNNGF